MKRDSLFTDCSRDVGLALRLLARRPGFSAIALVTLALGIGAPTAVFSVVRAVLLRPLPYPEADRVVSFRIESQSPAGPVAFDALPAAQALAWSARSTTLSSLALFNDRALTLSTGDGPFRLSGISATPNLFDLLGAKPALGRTFDAARRDMHEVVLSHDTWQRYFGASPGVLDSAVTLDGAAFRVVGIMPEGFRFPTPEAAFWTPVELDTGSTRGMLLPAIARLQPGATVGAVVQEGKSLLDSFGGPRMEQRTLVVRTLREQMVGGVERVLWILLAAVGLVVVIATTNIAVLLLTRGASREHEFSVRLALGAGRGRLVRQLMAESLMLGALGGAAGLLVAWVGLRLLVRLAPADMPRLEESTLDGYVLVFAMALTAATSLVFGLLSAGRTIAIDPVRALGGSGVESRLSVAQIPRHRRMNVLTAAELALTTVLLLGAGLLLRSFVAQVRVDHGFDPSGALALQISLPSARYPTAEARVALHERLLERLAHPSGIHVAGLATAMPNRQPTGRFAYSADGLPDRSEPFSLPIAEVRMVSEGFFEALGIPLRAGRTFRREDAPGAEPVIVISERLARLRFQERSPVGQILYSHSGNRRVVGVVADVRRAAEFAPADGAAYIPMRQESAVFSWHAGLTVVVRGSNPGALARSLRSLLLSLDPEMPPFNVRGLDQEVSKLVAGPRFSAAALGAFAIVALVMATVGVYGVMAYSAERRTREIGVRLALGATRAQVLLLVMRGGAIVVAGGLITGLVAAAWLARALTGMLHEVTPADPAALATVAMVLAASGLTAAYLPARRATRLDILNALRNE